MKPEERFHEHHQRLIDDFKNHRDKAKVNPDSSGRDLVDFLRDEIRPHAEAEEEVLYAEIDHRVGDDVATGTMRSEHETLSALIEQLDDQINNSDEFRRTLDQFSSILLNHFEKEEEVLIPYLSDELTEEQFLEILGEVHDSEEQHAHS